MDDHLIVAKVIVIELQLERKRGTQKRKELKQYRNFNWERFTETGFAEDGELL